MRADNVGAPVTPQQWNYIHEMGGALRSSLDNVTAVFAPSCIGHAVLSKRDWVNIKIDDISLPSALRCWEHSTRRKRHDKLKRSTEASTVVSSHHPNNQRHQRHRQRQQRQKQNNVAQAGTPRKHNHLSKEEREERKRLRQEQRQRRKQQRRRQEQHRNANASQKNRNRKNNSPKSSNGGDTRKQRRRQPLTPEQRQEQRKRRRKQQQQEQLQPHAQMQQEQPAAVVAEEPAQKLRSSNNASAGTKSKKRQRLPRVPEKCGLRLLERCSWPQCNHSCPTLTNPMTGEEMRFLELLTAFGLDIEAVAAALGVDMHTLNNMERTELVNLLTQQAS